MKKNIVIIHYNTPHLTECLVRSINLYVKNAAIYIFDNSDKNPFTAKFDNVIVFDNTRGQIIDFDKWLEKYPNRIKSNGRANNYASAKHCYSVEKCMELLNDNFILLDSDVLLKKDISELYDNRYIYCGEVINQPNSQIKRLLPFICYINTKMCFENDIHYFDDRYMHGLANNTVNVDSDKYDTGAGFYILTSSLEHKDINISDYIVHYAHGSWDKKGENNILTPIEWLDRYKKYWTNERNNKVVYTCISGKYDSLLDPKYVSDGFDYICFTDNEGFKSDIWEIRPLPKETEELTQVKKQRYVKINPHKLLGEYEMSIWVDGNITIKSDLNEFINEEIEDDISVYVPQHPQRNCIYDEAKAVLGIKKDVKENVIPQIERYKKEGFPQNYGMLQSGILFRKHNNKDCIRLMEDWFNELKNNSHRDQLSFNYVCWKNKDVKVKYIDKSIFDSKWFKWNKYHNFKKPNTIVLNKPKQNVEVKTKPKINARQIMTYKIGIY